MSELEDMQAAKANPAEAMAFAAIGRVMIDSMAMDLRASQELYQREQRERDRQERAEARALRRLELAQGQELLRIAEEWE